MGSKSLLRHGASEMLWGSFLFHSSPASMKQQKADCRSQRTYRLVNAAFAELAVEKPYNEILVQDILDRVGIGRTTFYAHYFDKEAFMLVAGDDSAFQSHTQEVQLIHCSKFFTLTRASNSTVASAQSFSNKPGASNS